MIVFWFILIIIVVVVVLTSRQGVKMDIPAMHSSGVLNKDEVLALPLCDRIQSNFDVRVHSLI
jgi:hypothetical protein